MSLTTWPASGVARITESLPVPRSLRRPWPWRVPPPWRCFLEAHGSQAPPLYTRDSGTHRFQSSTGLLEPTARGCQPIQAALLSGQQGRLQDQMGCPGPQQGEPGLPPRPPLQLKHALPPRERRTGGCATRGADAPHKGGGSYLYTLVAFQSRKPQGTCLSLQRKDKNQETFERD